MRTGPLFVHVDDDGDELIVVKTGSVDMYAVEILPGGELSRVRVVDLPAVDLRRLYDALRDHLGETGRPVVSVDPAMRFGGPHIKGISTDAIVGLYIAEQGNAEAVQDDYGLTRHELLLALWFEGTHGPKAMRRLLGKWASEGAGSMLAGWDRATKAEDLALPEVAVDLPRY